MKTLLIIPLVLMSLISQDVWAEKTHFKQWSEWMDDNRKPIDGEMSCKITDQVIVGVEEGKPFRCTGYKGEPEVGDSLTFTYSSYNDLIKVKLIHPKEEFIDTLIAAEKGKKDAKGIHFVDPMHDNIFIVARLKIFPNQINYVHHNLLGGETLNLYRYYKSDWNGIYTGLFGSQTQILSFDCRTISNQIDQIINRYRTYPGMPDSLLD